jgi:uncharacterized paraquat-inducible protein A
MDFQEFVDWLYKIGWRAVGDAQHTQIRELWGELVARGLIVWKGGITPATTDKGLNTCPHCNYILNFETCPKCGEWVNRPLPLS